jgi:hypothetical protein
VLKEKELEKLDQLYYQKDNFRFNTWIQDIEKNVKEEA